MDELYDNMVIDKEYYDCGKLLKINDFNNYLFENGEIELFLRTSCCDYWETLILSNGMDYEIHDNIKYKFINICDLIGKDIHKITISNNSELMKNHLLDDFDDYDNFDNFEDEYDQFYDFEEESDRFKLNLKENEHIYEINNNIKDIKKCKDIKISKKNKIINEKISKVYLSYEFGIITFYTTDNCFVKILYIHQHNGYYAESFVYYTDLKSIKIEEIKSIGKMISYDFSYFREKLNNIILKFSKYDIYIDMDLIPKNEFKLNILGNLDNILENSDDNDIIFNMENDAIIIQMYIMDKKKNNLLKLKDKFIFNLKPYYNDKYLIYPAYVVKKLI